MKGHTVESARADDLEIGPFLVNFAIGEEGRLEEYRLRYRVFVEERGFEDGCADRLERDEFDKASCSLLLRDAVTGEVAACQRLILPDHLPSDMRTNVERLYRPLDGQVHVCWAEIPRCSWAEASRTTIAPNYRWGSAGTRLPAMVAIKYASIALAVAFGRSTLFSLSELPTARLIRRTGFEMVQIGAPVEFHGKRAPFRMDVASMVQSVTPPYRDALDRLIQAARRLASNGQFGQGRRPTGAA